MLVTSDTKHQTPKHQPQRTCAATHTKHPQSALLRFVNIKGVPTPEALLGPRRAPGRGVYILPTPEALAIAVKRKVFAHRLKTNQPPLPWAEIAPFIPSFLAPGNLPITP
jgi:predicted RNA-binding protein YlxR (DUF448 family)